MGRATPCIVVIAGLDPAIHRSGNALKFLMDARLEPAHDDPAIGDAQ
jgi:hypothetical protein